MTKFIQTYHEFADWVLLNDHNEYDYTLDISNAISNNGKERVQWHQCIEWLIDEHKFEVIAGNENLFMDKRVSATRFEETARQVEQFILKKGNIYVFVNIDNGIFTIMSSHCNKEKVFALARLLVNEFVQINPRNLPPEKLDAKGKIYLMMEINRQLTLKSFKLSVPEAPVNLCYSNEFINGEHNKIFSTLLTDKPGIHLFHGMPGTGKTTYIRHLTKLVNKRFIFMPTNFGEMLSNPAFIPFIMAYPESIIVMEDAEITIKQRNLQGNHNAIANVLNMADGLLGDVIRCQFIFTFNCELEKIDSAITRPGRCLSNIEFGKLNAQKANDLASFLNLNKSFKESATLAEITNGII